MTRTASAGGVHTYVPDDRQDEQIVDFARALDALRDPTGDQLPALVGVDGSRHEVPQSMFDLLRQVADALAGGMAVTVAPMNAMLTTQEAADFLGIARPTLVRILERGEIPMEKPGRHRYVRLQDLLVYQEQRRAQTREALAQTVADAEQDDLYARTDGPPPVTR